MVVIVREEKGGAENYNHVIFFLRVGEELQGLPVELVKKGFPEITNLGTTHVNLVISREIEGIRYHAFVVSSDHPQGHENSPTFLRECLARMEMHQLLSSDKKAAIAVNTGMIDLPGFAEHGGNRKKFLQVFQESKRMFHLF